jgi:cupin superfamily acireductone dioxygenase involved in methionine salvage
MRNANTDLMIVDNVFVKMMHFYYKGDVTERDGHSHTFDHITLLARGSVLMEVLEEGGTAKEHKAPKLIVTPKNTRHKFTALEADTVLCCIHAIRDGDDVDDVAPQGISADEAMQLMQKFPLVHMEPENVA